ncbi:phage minor capsid protein [Clostridium perfringens]|nr:phage minor capsid protein [Clostridium perfringens]
MDFKQEYPDFIESTGYGTGSGLGGWNCRTT